MKMISFIVEPPRDPCLVTDNYSIREHFSFMKLKLQGSNYSRSLLTWNIFTAPIPVIFENKNVMNNDVLMRIEDIRIKR
jgi:hypothetical protein